MPRPRSPRRRPEGVVVRHSRRCASRSASGCDCRPSYQAQVFSALDQRTIRKTFRSLAEARSWRSETQSALRRGTLRAPTRTTLEEAAEAWIAGARAGVVRTRSGDPYKPSALRAYELSLRKRIIPELGALRLSSVSRVAIQDMVDRMVAAGHDASTVRNTILPLRAIFRRALARSEVAVNPTLGLALPAYRGRRERIARPSEAEALLGALPERDRALWATALYAGLRRGELKALRWSDVDFDAGLIRVERGWDDREGPILPKSRAGTRKVPLTRPLRTYLLGYRLSRPPELELAFGRTDGRAFSPEGLVKRARRHWAEADLEPIGLHECRHTFAAFMIAAGVNAKALSSYMGHSTITMTLDRYGHLMPGNEVEAAEMLRAYLERECAV